jgi:methionine biosynthesis protein MetW
MPLNDFKDYDDYWTQRAKTSPQQVVLHRFVSIADRIPDGSSVIDIGCGDGAFLAYLKEHRPKSIVFGMDISANAVSFLKKREINGAAITAGKSLREIAGRDFDYVVMMEVIEHVHDAEGLFLQALRFNPKTLFITIPNTGYIMHRLRLMFGGRFPITYIIYHMKEHIRFWTVKDFIQWAESMGCKVVCYRGQEKTINPLRLYLIRHFPSLFAAQMIYEVEPKHST